MVANPSSPIHCLLSRTLRTCTLAAPGARRHGPPRPPWRHCRAPPRRTLGGCGCVGGGGPRGGAADAGGAGWSSGRFGRTTRTPGPRTGPAPACVRPQPLIWHSGARSRGEGGPAWLGACGPASTAEGTAGVSAREGGPRTTCHQQCWPTTGVAPGCDCRPKAAAGADCTGLVE